MVDDLLCVSECGPETTKSNAYINYKIKSKKLQCGTVKCKILHVGKSHDKLPCQELYIDGWNEIKVKDTETGQIKLMDIFEGQDILKVEDSEKYLGLRIH